MAEAEASLDVVRASERELSTLPFWVDTVEALLDATADIARAAQAGDAEALAEAQAAFEVAADDAARADQALTIALGEATAGITGPASASSAACPAGGRGDPGRAGEPVYTPLTFRRGHAKPYGPRNRVPRRADAATR